MIGAYIAFVVIWEGKNLTYNCQSPTSSFVYREQGAEKKRQPRGVSTVGGTDELGETQNGSNPVGGVQADFDRSEDNDDNNFNVVIYPVLEEMVDKEDVTNDYSFVRHGGGDVGAVTSTTTTTTRTKTEHVAQDEDRMAGMNDLIRPRPNGLRLIFVGDSLTRYQYLSLAYWLRHGRWFDPSIYPKNLVNAHSFRDSSRPENDWNEFFQQSNNMLQPNELCDCIRRSHEEVAVERRYFRDDIRDNTLVYINVSGENTPGHEGLYGRVDPSRVFSQSKTPQEGHHLLRSGLLAENEIGNEWEYANWGELIRHHVGALNLGPSAVAILNAGLHEHRFHDSLRTVSLKEALEDASIKGVWKTTTFAKDQVLSMIIKEQAERSMTKSFSALYWKSSTANQKEKENKEENKMTLIDQEMCFLMDDCFDLSWMIDLNPDLYYDNLHFNEPVYRILNEELLTQLNLLPVTYEALDRSIILRKP